MYFNLAVNGTWQVQNIPVLSREGEGIDQTLRYYFDLGQSGPVQNVQYAYTFTEYVQTSRPGGSHPASVLNDRIAMWAGNDGGRMPDLERARPLIGGPIDGGLTLGKKHAHKKFPNQHAGPMECAPAAISNSLQFLNEVKGLKMPADKLTIAEMKKACGFKDDWGAPLDTWWELKDKYMKDNKYPITTRKITSMKDLIAEIDDSQDVEIQESWLVPVDPKDPNGPKKRTGHTTALVGITPLADGRYSLDIVDDQDQKSDKNDLTKTRTYIYDPKTNEFDEAGFKSKFEYAVVECPEPASLVLLLIGVMTRLRRTGRVA
jgi:hypothetical protein